MFSDVFLAMTAGEIKAPLPPKMAYMACHFSSYNKGLSNLPAVLPPESLLLLDDSIPPTFHDASIVTDQLKDLVARFSAKGVLLDFQNPKTPESKAMVSHLLQQLPCKVAVTEPYAKDIQCPVFLSPTPVNMSLSKQLSPWLQQGVYLEIAPGALQFTVTEKGSICQTIPANDAQPLPLADRRLHCHYQVEVSREKAVFTLRRNQSDLASLVKEAYDFGILGAVGLYQELAGK